MRRLFIAINLPENIKQQVENLISQLEIDADIHWLPPMNWHLTIAFLGYQPDKTIGPILNSLKETIMSVNKENQYKSESDIKIEFDKIILAPPYKPPKMIWLTGAKKTSKTLGEIKIKLEDELVKNGVKFKREKREYNSHITLARFSSLLNADYKQISANINRVNQYLNRHKSMLIFYAKSLDLMQSYLKKTGAEYEVLVKMDFSK